MSADSYAEQYHEATGQPPVENPNAIAPPAASPADRFVLFLAVLDDIAVDRDPQRTGPTFTAQPGEHPLATLLRFTVPECERRSPGGRGIWVEPEQTGIGVVIEYGAGPVPRPHVLLCEDGTYRQVEFAHLAEI